MRTHLRPVHCRTLAVVALALLLGLPAAAAPQPVDDLSRLRAQIFAPAPEPAATSSSVASTIYCCAGIQLCCEPMTLAQCESWGGRRYLHQGAARLISGQRNAPADNAPRQPVARFASRWRAAPAGSTPRQPIARRIAVWRGPPADNKPRQPLARPASG